MTGNPPPEVQAAARVVQNWLDQQQRARLAQDTPPPMSAAERYRRRQYDQDPKPMAPWRDPRAA
jgi:hypothetical protein